MAIVDTGIDCAHEDLVPQCLAGWNFYDQTSDTHDVYGHGTKIAGVIAAVGDNGRGIAGAGWNITLLPIRASDAQGYASYSALA